MRIAVQGSKNFSDYNIFLRAMRTALYAMPEDDNVIEIYALGPVTVNNMAIGFSNVSEDSLRGRGIKISCHKRPEKWGEDNISTIDYLAYFCKPGDSYSKLVHLADKLDMNPGVYSYE